MTSASKAHACSMSSSVEAPLVSVILPMFNASSTVGEAISSCLLQKGISSFEVIVIDDGSTDGSIDIARVAAGDDPRVTIVRQENAGVCIARNAGLDRARGEWIVFLDADDVLAPHAFELLLRVSNCCDVVLGGAVIRATAENPSSGSAVSFGRDDAMALCLSFWNNWRAVPYPLFSQGVIFRSVWSKLIRRSLLERYRMRFQAGLRFCEDALFMFDVYQHANRIVLLDETVYTYRDNPASVTSAVSAVDAPHIKRLLDRLLCCTEENPLRKALFAQCGMREVLTFASSLSGGNPSVAEGVLREIADSRSYKALDAAAGPCRYSRGFLGNIKNRVLLGFLRRGRVRGAIYFTRWAYGCKGMCP